LSERLEEELIAAIVCSPLDVPARFFAQERRT
jgi:hypothetical protein